jgi:monoamine oxidase
VESADIVVVGAGVAGLTAARELARAGARVVVLEARARAGGRILTERPHAWHPVELGAEFVHGEQPELAALARDAGLTLRAVEARHFLLAAGGLTPVGEFERMEALVAEAANAPWSESALEFLERRKVEPALARWVTHFVEGFHAAPLERVSVRSLAEQGTSSESQSRIEQGYDSLVTYLERDAAEHGANVSYSQPVRAVRLLPAGVEVTARSTTLRANLVVIALPLAVL